MPGRPKILRIVRQGPVELAVGAGEGWLDIFTLLYLFSSLSPSLCETARYRLIYCLKGPLNPKQPIISGRLQEKEKEKIDERNNVQTPPSAPTASTIAPCPTVIKIRRTPRKFT